MYCAKCGKKNADDRLFCGFCGSPLNTPDEAAPERDEERRLYGRPEAEVAPDDGAVFAALPPRAPCKGGGDGRGECRARIRRRDGGARKTGSAARGRGSLRPPRGGRAGSAAQGRGPLRPPRDGRAGSAAQGRGPLRPYRGGRTGSAAQGRGPLRPYRDGRAGSAAQGRGPLRPYRGGRTGSAARGWRPLRPPRDGASRKAPRRDEGRYGRTETSARRDRRTEEATTDPLAKPLLDKPVELRVKHPPRLARTDAPVAPRAAAGLRRANTVVPPRQIDPDNMFFEDEDEAEDDLADFVSEYFDDYRYEEPGKAELFSAPYPRRRLPDACWRS